jgi:hypothetical protein
LHFDAAERPPFRGSLADKTRRPYYGGVIGSEDGSAEKHSYAPDYALGMGFSHAQPGELPTSEGVAVMPRVERALVAAEITPRGGKEREAARALQTMGFRVHAVGTTISVDAPRERWKAAFAARFTPAHREKRRTPGAATSTPHVSPVAFQVPAALEPLVESVVFVEPPELF